MLTTPIPAEGTPSSVHEGLGSLLRANAHQAFLYALSNFTPEESIAFKAAFTRGLRVLAVAFAECVGPSQWGLKPESSQVRHESKFALETLFKVTFAVPSQSVTYVLICYLMSTDGSFGRLSPFIRRQISANRNIHRLDARIYPLHTNISDQSHRMAPTSGAG